MSNKFYVDYNFVCALNTIIYYYFVLFNFFIFDACNEYLLRIPYISDITSIFTLLFVQVCPHPTCICLHYWSLMVAAVHIPYSNSLKNLILYSSLLPI